MELILQHPEFVTATFYVRDASGNVMAVYKTSGTTNLTLEEQHIYGSSRLGIFKKDKTIKNKARALGERRYELTDHLGNVRVVMSDYKRTAVIVLSATDYYPFGMVARTYASSEIYRYGFNGKEHEDDLTGGDYDFGARIYDSRLARWLAVDPAFIEYRSWSPYCYTMNSPIYMSDHDGEKPRVEVIWSNDGKTVTINITNHLFVVGKRKNTPLNYTTEGINKYLRGGTTYVEGVEVIVNINTEITNVKSIKEAAKRIQANDGFGVVVLHNPRKKGTPYWQSAEDINKPYDMIHTYKTTGSRGVGHETGHDLGFGDHYVWIKDVSYITTKACDQGGGLMSTLDPLSAAELFTIADHVINKGTISTGQDRPVDMTLDDLVIGSEIQVVDYDWKSATVKSDPFTVKVLNNAPVTAKRIDESTSSGTTTPADPAPKNKKK
jgi:RHS repeat-associated protein